MSAISRETIQSVWEIIPPDALEEVTLLDNAGATVGTYAHAERKKLSFRQVAMVGAIIGQSWLTFTLYQDQEAFAPLSSYKLVDAAGVTWEVKSVDTDMVQRIHDCICLKDAV